MPYMLPDLGSMLAIRIFGFNLACPIWSTLTMLVLVLAVWIYARQMLTSSWAVGAAVLCGWYFATNYLFIQGFFSFQWGVAAAFLALAALEAWRRTNARGWMILYVAACFICYGSHLASFAMLAAIVATTGLIKWRGWMRFGCELLPLAVLGGYQLTMLHSVGGMIERSTLKDKLGHFIEAFFVRQNYVMDRSILALFWCIVLVTIWFSMRRGADFRKQWELAAICGLAAVIYFALPFGLAGIVYVDERALPFFFMPLTILALRMFEDSQPAGRHVALLTTACALLAIANLGSLAWFLPAQNSELAEYREALRRIPEGKTVLPILTRQRSGNTYPLRHAGSFYAAERGGYVPYLFSQVNASGPAGYFVDLSTIYRPPQSWYLDHTEVDWRKVNEAYEYVVITKPWIEGRIDTSRLETFYENSVATVFRVLKQ